MMLSEIRVGQRVRFVARTGILREGVVSMIRPNGLVSVEYFSSGRRAWIVRKVPPAQLVKMPE